MIGAVILAHGNLHRSGQLARALVAGGCKVVIHADLGCSKPAFETLSAELSPDPNIRFAPRRRCEWGRFSLVEASLDAVRLLLSTWPEVTHVCQLSGACIPLRPITELQAFLEARPGTDFIEAIPIAADPWVIGGLSEERFTLYHPFSWKRQRRLFDLSVRLQRLFRVRRQMPDRLKPCIGSQWWCLSAGTLRAILADGNLPRFMRFFRSSWIPDETFFQTLATRHGHSIETTPLTFVRFDPQGKPFAFYDDHLEVLLSVDAFFARKVWPGADKLYDTFLGPELAAVQPEKRRTEDVLRRLERARNLRIEGRRGMLGPGRHPVRVRIGPDYQTARPYTVFDGFAPILPGLRDGLNSDQRMRSHGALFARTGAEFFDGGDFFEGNLPADAPIRDYRPEQFLVNLIWSDRRRSQVFQHRLTDPHPIRDFLLADPNAQIIRLREGWLLDLLDYQAEADGDLARRARKALAIEAWLRTRMMRVEADILPVSLADLLAAPGKSAVSLGAVMPPYVDLAPLLSQVLVPEGLEPLIARLRRIETASRDLATLSHLLTRRDRAQTILSRKT